MTLEQAVAAVCDYIQFDEPMWTESPGQSEWAAGILNELIDSLPKVRIGLHVCGGNPRRKRVYFTKYTGLVPAFRKVKIDEVSLEHCTLGYDLMELWKDWDFAGDLALGVTCCAEGEKRLFGKLATRMSIREARRQAAYPWLMSMPRLGPVSVAQLLAVVGTPHRFRSKRQFWTYVGLAVVTRTTADQEVVKGVLRRTRRPVATRGLNRNHNHLLKRVFKTAATSACQSGPFAVAYATRVQQGMDPALARLTIARQLAAITLSLWKRGEMFQAERLKQSAT